MGLLDRHTFNRAQPAIGSFVRGVGRRIEDPRIAQLLDRYPAGDTPAVDLDDLDLLDPWVIDGRYAADLPGLTPGDARRLMTAAERMVDDCLRTGPNSTSERNKRERSQRSRTAVNTKHRLGSRWEAICSVAEKL